jgi:hypothetical protein
MVVAALGVAAPAAQAASAPGPVPARAPRFQVDARHQALITRQDAAEQRVSDARDPSPRAADPATSRPVPSGGGGWSSELLLAVGTTLGAGLLTGIAGLGVGRRRERMGHPVH